ncbi:MAG: hypothetical protein IJO76_05900 [Clostridia bacterium]|nr:hypothetical protein [Clostridia bacterium]
MKLFYGTNSELFGYNPNTDWMAEGKYGVCIGYLNQLINRADRPQSLGKQTDWDTCVKEFDVKKLVDQVAEMDPAYLCVTLHQGTEFICVPSEVFNTAAGVKPGECCATRDLIAEMIPLLKEKGIPLMLYFTGDGPWMNSDVMTKLCDAPFPGSPSEFKPHHWTPTFKKNWFAVARELSLRYGEHVKAWWIDGADACKDYNDAELLLFKANLLAGNPNAVMCFNPGGEMTPPWRYSIADDFVAGESKYFDDYPEDRWVDGAQWQILSYLSHLQEQCAEKGTDTAEEMADYIKAVAEKQGVVTIDLRVCRDGSILPEQVEIMKKVKKAIRG